MSESISTSGFFVSAKLFLTVAHGIPVEKEAELRDKSSQRCWINQARRNEPYCPSCCRSPKLCLTYPADQSTTCTYASLLQIDRNVDIAVFRVEAPMQNFIQLSDLSALSKNSAPGLRLCTIGYNGKFEGDFAIVVKAYVDSLSPSRAQEIRQAGYTGSMMVSSLSRVISRTQRILRYPYINCYSTQTRKALPLVDCWLINLKGGSIQSQAGSGSTEHQ